MNYLKKLQMFGSRRGLTLTELVITMLIVVIAILAVSGVLADSHRGWNRMYNRVYSGVVTDAHFARRAFDRVCRKAINGNYIVGSVGEFIEVYGYDNWASEKPDTYARFYIDQQKLILEEGSLEEGTFNHTTVLSSVTLANNVQGVDFSRTGDSVKMILDLDNGKESLTVTCSAVRHNSQ